MASMFFRSIPNSRTVRDPYEEVFMLFTTETSETPWAHNRSVSQNSTRLEVELDFTPAPSPTVSQPGSRPDSRASGSGGIPGSAAFSPNLVVGTTAQVSSSSSASPLTSPLGVGSVGASVLVSPSPLFSSSDYFGSSSNGVIATTTTTSSSDALSKSPIVSVTRASNIGLGLKQSTPTETNHSRPPTPDPNAGELQLFQGNKNIQDVNTDDDHGESEDLSNMDIHSARQSPVPTTRPRSSRALAARAIMGNRKSNRRLLTDAGGSGTSPTTADEGGAGPSRQHQREEQHGKLKSEKTKKPVVIHQSLSTLSQPGQTGTVVWDSSILMAKFLLSIKSLDTRYYLPHEGGTSSRSRRGDKERRKRRSSSWIQEQQVRNLEDQAKHMTVSSNGELLDNASDQGTKKTLLDGRDDSGAEDPLSSSSSSDSDTDNDDDLDDDDGDGNGERRKELVFDPTKTTILELGSGCGLLGIVLAEFCKDLLLTDQAPVLPLLVKNLRKNLDKKYFDHDSRSSNTSLQSSLSSSSSSKRSQRNTTQSNAIGSTQDAAQAPCHVQVQELVWGQELDQDLKRSQGVDFVIATDVVYNEAVVPKLVQTLKSLCELRSKVRQDIKDQRANGRQAHRGGGDSGRDRMNLPQRTVVLLGQELRTDYVHLSFLEGLEQAGFRMVRMPKQMMDAEFQSGYVIYAMYLKT
ncbi:hypothetical protein BGZ94_000005 [Podila epigama]|nr:hypothetical protein BGZ94_000005 [Podila epigama]